MLVSQGVGSPSFAAQERYEYDAVGRLIRYVDANSQVTDYRYDAAGNIVSVVGGGAASNYAPGLVSVAPNFIRRGQTLPITLTGQRLETGALQTSDTALDVSNVRRTPTQIQADLTAGPSATVGSQTLVFSNAAGSASIGITVGMQLPQLSVEPSPLALPPDTAARSITLRLSSADLMAHQVAISSSDTAKAGVSPAAVTFAAGQTSTQISITTKTAGFVNLQLTSTTLGALTVPVFITSDFRGVNTSQAPPVGVVVGEAQPPTTPPTGPGTFGGSLIGVVVGATLTDVLPKALPVGSGATLVIRGAHIPANVQVSAVPAAGFILDAPSVSADGQQITVGVNVDASATRGPRRIVVTDAAANRLAFADVSKSQVLLTSGQPEIASMSPLFAKPGTTMRLKVRGRHLQNARLVITPGVDLWVDAQPVISADGTELQAYIQISPLAAAGPRTVQIMSPSGSTTNEATSANQFTLVSEVQNDVTPIFAPPVGVVVESTSAAPVTQTVSPVAAPNVGIAVGPFAASLQPKVGVVGTSVELVINGQGLQAVRAASAVAASGLTLGAIIVNAEGTQLTVPVGIAADAPKTLRRLVLTTTAGALHFIDPSEANFLVAAPSPELIAVAPQVVKAGQAAAVVLRGKNFRDVTGVRFDPPQGLTAPVLWTASADGTQLSFNLQTAADAATGPRTVIVTTAGGASSAIQVPANTLYVAQQTSPPYADILAPAVGVLVGEQAPAPAASKLDIHAPAVGVVLESVPSVATTSQLVAAAQVRVIVGAAITDMSPVKPDGFVKGTSGSVVFTGVGLDQVASARVTGGTAIGLNGFTVNADGTQLTLPVTIDAAAPSSSYGASLYTGTGAASTRITSVNFDHYAFGVGALPSLLESVSPIVLEQGKSYTFTVRGDGLKDVFQVFAEPASGLNFGHDQVPVQWATDALGEKLTVRVLVSSDAPVGSRVVRLRVPGGITDAAAIPANTITVVSPQ